MTMGSSSGLPSNQAAQWFAEGRIEFRDKRAWFDGLHAVLQRLGRLAGHDRNAAGNDARPAVELLSDEMHGTAVMRIAGVEHSLVCI